MPQVKSHPARLYLCEHGTVVFARLCLDPTKPCASVPPFQLQLRGEVRQDGERGPRRGLVAKRPDRGQGRSTDDRGDANHARDPKPERIQGAFVSEGEVHAVVDWTKQQQDAKYRDTEVFEPAQKTAQAEEEFEGEDPEIVKQAIELVVRSQLGSTSMLQRKLRIGFARAGRVMDILERKGIVGPSEGSKARTVLLAEDELDSVLVSD